MSSPRPSSSSPGLTRAEMLAAAEARTRAADAEGHQKEAFVESDHELRQKFRRLIDPGILKHNDKKAAYAAFDTLLKLSDNLAKEPENPKFQLFKATNKRIKDTLIDVKGALEYAVELGFRLDVQDMQPVYIFRATPVHLQSLRIGAEIIREITSARAEQEARAKEGAAAQKAAHKDAIQKALLAYEEDRMTVRRRNEREAIQRQAALAREAAGQTPAPAPLRTTPSAPVRRPMPMIPIPPPQADTSMDEDQDHDEEVEEEEEEEEESYLPPNVRRPPRRGRGRGRTSYPGQGRSLSGQVEGPNAEAATEPAPADNDDSEDDPPPYMPGGRPTSYPGEGHRLGE